MKYNNKDFIVGGYHKITIVTGEERIVRCGLKKNHLIDEINFDYYYLCKEQVGIDNVNLKIEYISKVEKCSPEDINLLMKARPDWFSSLDEPFNEEEEEEAFSAIFTSNNSMQIKRLAKADDMANFIWELVHNGWRKFKHTDYDYEPAWERISELLQEHGIIIDDLTN